MSTLAVTPQVSRKRGSRSHVVNEQAAAKTLGQLIGNVQSGSLSAAQVDLASLTEQLGSSASSEAASPLGRMLTQLRGDLRAGNVCGAQASVQNFLLSLATSRSTQ